MRSKLAELHADNQQLGSAPRNDSDVRDQARFNAVGDQAGKLLLIGKRGRRTHNSPCLVLDPDNEHSAGGIRERHDRTEHPVRRGQVPLELHRLALRRSQNQLDVHNSAVYSAQMGLMNVPSSEIEHRTGPARATRHEFRAEFCRVDESSGIPVTELVCRQRDRWGGARSRSKIRRPASVDLPLVRRQREARGFGESKDDCGGPELDIRQWHGGVLRSSCPMLHGRRGRARARSIRRSGVRG
jgi:hypothetical protein